MTESTKRLVANTKAAEAEANELAREIENALASTPEIATAFQNLMEAVGRYMFLYGLQQHRAGFDKGIREEPIPTPVEPIDAELALLTVPTDEEIDALIENLRQAGPPVSDSEFRLIYGRNGGLRHQAIFALADLEEAAVGVTDPETAAVLWARFHRLDGMIRATDIAAAYHRGIEIARNEAIIPAPGLPVQ